jgi:putative endonuclease
MNYVYIIECSDGSLYTGWTVDIKKRLEMHNGGKGAKYTKSRCPVILRYFEVHPAKQDALKREREIKRLTRADKLELCDAFRGILPY